MVHLLFIPDALSVLTISSYRLGEIASIRSKSRFSIIIGCFLEPCSLICVWESSYKAMLFCSIFLLWVDSEKAYDLSSLTSSYCFKNLNGIDRFFGFEDSHFYINPQARRLCCARCPPESQKEAARSFEYFLTVKVRHWNFHWAQK